MTDFLERTKILIVEDEVIIAADLESRLKGLGYDVCGKVTCGREAMAMVEQHRPDLVLMDIVLQGQPDGIDTAESIREKWGIPVVFLTAYADTDRLERVKMTYPFGYLLKPFQDRDLKITLEMALYLAKVDKERRRVEEVLRESEKRYQKAQAIGHVGSWEYNIQTTQFWGSDEAKRIYGFDAKIDTFSTDEVENCIPDRERIHQALVDLIEDDKEYNLEFDIITKNTKTRKTIISIAELDKDEAGRPIKITGVIQDITDRKKAEEALQESETRFKQLFENMADGLAIYQAVDDGLDFILVDINRKGQEISQIFGEEAVGALVTQTFSDVEQIGLLDVFRRVYKTNSSEHYPMKRYRNRRVEQWVEYFVFKIPSGLIVALFSDTSEIHRAKEEQERLQAQLLQAYKMESLGTLTGGISHDFNNLLQAINGYTQLLLLDKPDHDPDYPSLKAIQDAGNRASALVHQLLLFSRKAETERQPVELNLEIEQARKILERTIPKMIEIEVHPGWRLWPIQADPVQIEQILLNFGTNAADAMPEGGRLILETENVILDEDYVLFPHGAEPGKYVLLTVVDTGHGMDKETLDHIFEPFFTTKEFGKGTGLGLASVYGIVKSHGGYITCYSEADQGTTFKIYLPAIEIEDTLADKDIEDEPPQGGTETILLVDDEEPIRSFASQALKKFGYKVLTSSSGEEALDVYSNIATKIDLLIMDIGMPGMGGHKCLQELLKIDARVKVIIASGYFINDQVKKSMAAGAAGFIGKPYQLKDLLKKVREALDEKE